MTAVRRHLLTGEPILHAPDRATRPHAFGQPEEPHERCPFCPGHESDTPPELTRAGDPWRVRVFPNKYPPIHGAEVIVETPSHDAAFGQIPHRHEVVATYIERLASHAPAPCTTLFRNDGVRAGASLSHPHAQLVPLPFVPPRVEREAHAFRNASACPLCAAIEMHRNENLIIAETEQFVWLTPSASWLPYQQWIVPKEHRPDLLALHDSGVAELAESLGMSAGATKQVAGAFNWSFLRFPGEPAAHWYVDVMPRLTSIAGLELGTGTFVEIIDPAAAAQRLRSLLN